MTVALFAGAISVLGLFLLAIAGPLYRIGLVGLPGAFTVLQWAEYAGLAGMAVSVMGGVLAHRRHARGTLVVAVLCFVGAATAFAIPFQLQRRAQMLPPIHDITTDLENPPAFDAITRLRGDVSSPIERSPLIDEEQRRGYPDLAPATLPQPISDIFERALAAAQQEGWVIVSADKSAGRIEATETTRWFGFTDDIVIRLTPWGSGTRIDVRSVSRTGGGDLGTNARRIRQYLDRLR
jgi:hypothetical protein